MAPDIHTFPGLVKNKLNSKPNSNYFTSSGISNSFSNYCLSSLPTKPHSYTSPSVVTAIDLDLHAATILIYFLPTKKGTILG
jgi:hypothetical protein